MATTTLLFWNLLHNPSTLTECMNEIISNLPPLQADEAAYPVTNLEASLPFLRNCMKENYRQTPVFSMPLARRVTSPEGLTIAGNHFPQGVCTPLIFCSTYFVAKTPCLDISSDLQPRIPPRPPSLRRGAHTIQPSALG